MSETKSKKEIAAMSFEDAMAALEAVVRQLEDGNVPLEASIALYEYGANLRAHCEARLAAAEEKVAQITQGADGAATGAKPVEIS